MAKGKRVLSMVVLFCALTLVVVAAPGEGGAGAGGGARGGGRGRAALTPEQRAEMAKVQKAASALANEFIAKEAGLTGEKAGTFVAALAAEQAASTKRMDEARKAAADGGQMDFRALMEENTKGLDAVLSANLNEEQTKKVRPLLGGGMMGGGLAGAVSGLLMAKVEEAKVKEALPILAKFQSESSAFRAKAREDNMSSEDQQAKIKEMREATSKELAKVIGDEAAKRWLETPMMGGGFGGGRGGRKGGGGGGAGGGA